MSDPTVEEQAKALGWTPKEDFRGDPEKFIEAEVYLERGETLLPLIKAQNRRLKEQVDSQANLLTEVKSQLKEASEAIKELKDSNSAINRQAAKDARAELLEGIKKARKDEDVEGEEALRTQLRNVDDVLEEAKEGKGEKKPNGKVADPDEGKIPEAVVQAFQSWAGENDWYGKDETKTILMNGVAAKLRGTAEGQRLPHDKFLLKAQELAEKLEGWPKEGKRTSKVGSGDGEGGGSGNGGKKGKSYNDLPADAKKECDKQAQRFVKDKGQWKTTEAYRKYYSEMYFNEE